MQTLQSELGDYDQEKVARLCRLLDYDEGTCMDGDRDEDRDGQVQSRDCEEGMEKGESRGNDAVGDDDDDDDRSCRNTRRSISRSSSSSSSDSDGPATSTDDIISPAEEHHHRTDDLLVFIRSSFLQIGTCK